MVEPEQTNVAKEPSPKEKAALPTTSSPRPVPAMTTLVLPRATERDKAPVKFPAETYVVTKGDTLFGIMRSYRDSLPKEDPRRKMAVSEFVASANIDRRRYHRLGADAPLPPLEVGDRLNLKQIFSRNELDAVRKTIEGERNEGSRALHSRKTEPPTLGNRAAVAISRARELVPLSNIVDYVKSGIQNGVKNFGERVSPELALAVIQQESSGNAHAVSSKNARGLMQLMPIAVKDLGKKLSGEDLFDPKLNIDAGIQYLAKLQKRFSHVDSDPRVRDRVVLAAYFLGPTDVEARVNSGKDERNTVINHWYPSQVVGRIPNAKARLEAVLAESQKK